MEGASPGLFPIRGQEKSQLRFEYGCRFFSEHCRESGGQGGRQQADADRDVRLLWHCVCSSLEGNPDYGCDCPGRFTIPLRITRNGQQDGPLVAV